MVQNARNARYGRSAGRGASRGVGRNVSGEATPEGVANIPMGREDHSQTGTNSQADALDVCELVAAMLVQTQQNAQILQITRDHQLFQQQQRETVHEDTGLNSFLKGKPTQFGGDFNPKGAEKWLQEIENIFSFTYCREKRRVGYATFMLTGDAEAWWRGKHRLLEEGGREIN